MPGARPEHGSGHAWSTARVLRKPKAKPLKRTECQLFLSVLQRIMVEWLLDVASLFTIGKSCLHKRSEGGEQMPLSWMSGLYIGYAAILGLLIGSFLNVCIYRLPAHETITRGHSYCPRCHHTLNGSDLVPVLSYLLLGRRCRYCREPISSRYARIELLTAAYFIFAASLWGPAQADRLQTGNPLLPGAIWGTAWQLNLQADLSKWVEGWPPEFFSLIMILLAVSCFCALLVRAMIIWDHGLPPKGLYLFILVPALLRLLVQPNRWINQLAGLVFALLFQIFLQRLRLTPDQKPAERWHDTAGAAALGLMAGLMAVQSVLAVSLIISVLTIGRQNKGKTSQSRIERLHRFLPLLGILIGSAAWLLF